MKSLADAQQQIAQAGLLPAQSMMEALAQLTASAVATQSVEERKPMEPISAAPSENKEDMHPIQALPLPLLPEALLSPPKGFPMPMAPMLNPQFLAQMFLAAQLQQSPKGALF